MIAEKAEGFVYCVSSLGVTGMRSEITTDIGGMVRLVKETKDIPCAVGFGISTPQQAAEMCQDADGVIVGSAIVKLCGANGRGRKRYCKTVRCEWQGMCSFRKRLCKKNVRGSEITQLCETFFFHPVDQERLAVFAPAGHAVELQDRKSGKDHCQ